MKIETGNVKITLNSGKVIELTQEEYEELKNNLKEYIYLSFPKPYEPIKNPWVLPDPYPYPNPYPIISYRTTTREDCPF